MKKIKNIVFDVGMVLADFRWEAYMRDKGILEERIKVLGKYMINNPIWAQLDLGEKSEEEVIAQFKEIVPEYAEDIDAFFTDMDDMVVEFPYAYEWIADLKKRGFDVYLLSNYPKTLYEIHWENFSFLDLVDGKVVSGFEQVIKPDQKIYHILLERYGLHAEECVFLDDRADNVKSAVSIGMKGIVFESYAQAKEALEACL